MVRYDDCIDIDVIVLVRYDCHGGSKIIMIDMIVMEAAMYTDFHIYTIKSLIMININD